MTFSSFKLFCLDIIVFRDHLTQREVLFFASDEILS